MDADQVLQVFQHWKDTMGHKRARMDLKRAQVIRDRLRDGYSVEDLTLAIDGNAASDWHQGNNDRRMKYDAIELILRDAAHVDRFIAMGEAAHKMIEAKQQRQAEAQKEAAPPTEEEKARVRELLRNVRLRRVA